MDAAFLYLETGRSFGHVSSLMIFDAPETNTEGEPFDPYEEYKKRIARDLDAFPPLTRRLVQVPMALDHPYWAKDPDFDLDYHVRHVALPGKSGKAELEAMVARLIGRPLDRERPLWEAWVIEGVGEGQFGLLTKMHHATVDGVAGAMMTLQMMSDVAAPAPDKVEKAQPIPPGNEVLGRAMFDLARRPRRMVKFQYAMAKELIKLGRSAAAREKMVMPHGVPPTPFNHSITPHRKFAYESVELARIKAVKNALGVTLNDVVMAIVAGAIRSYLDELGELPDVPLVAMVPVSIRTGTEEDPWTNRVSNMMADLPTHLADPADRVAAIAKTMSEAKERHQLIPAELLVDVASIAPGLIAHQAARIAMNPRVADSSVNPANLVISNVPGPREQLSLGGAILRNYIPVSTVVDGQGLNVTVQSYDKNLEFGLVSCRELVEDLDHVVALHVAELEILEALAGIK